MSDIRKKAREFFGIVSSQASPYVDVFHTSGATGHFGEGVSDLRGSDIFNSVVNLINNPYVRSVTMGSDKLEEQTFNF